MNKKVRNDILLALSVVILAAVLFFVFRQDAQSGQWVVIEQNGVETARLPMEEERTYAVESSLGHNLIHISSQGVWMEDADCPDGLCVNQGKITTTNQRIVCLPHRLVIKIVAGDGNALDDVGR